MSESQSTLQPDNPAWKPETRRRIQQALNDVVRTAADICHRYTNAGGAYEIPGDIAKYGDVTGLMALGRTQVLDPLQDKINVAYAALAAVRREIDDYKRSLYGPGYRPLWADDPDTARQQDAPAANE